MMDPEDPDRWEDTDRADDMDFACAFLLSELRSVYCKQYKKMANVRDSDTSLWLHNKLGSNEPWTSGSITSQLNAEVLRNIKECFIDLQTQVKLKLLLSFFHIPKRSIDEWRLELEEILEVAQADSEQWVAMLAEILKSFPTTNCLHIDITEPEENRRIFYDLAEEVTKEMKRNILNLLPIECHYLNKTALNSVVGSQKPIIKHFNQRNKLKSVVLRKELLDRANDAAKHNLKKIPAPTIPLRTRGMPRKMTDTTPLKGIPSLHSALRGTSGTPTSLVPQRPTVVRHGSEKKGGIKMLDIADQPMGFGINKRRRKATDGEDFKRVGSQSEELAGTEGPDYAAGLPSSVRVPTPPPPTTPTVPTPTTSALFQTSNPTPSQLTNPVPVTPLPYRQTPTESPRRSTATSKKDDRDLYESPNPPVTTPPHGVREAKMAPTSPPPAQPPPPAIPTPASGHSMTKTVILQVPNHTAQNYVTLSKELMEKAQAIFVTANRATRPEKEHILKFMAGTRENPCPELGNIVTIKLSERDELHPQRDGTWVSAIVETHFQMNYNTGEWKVITKPPKIVQ